MAKKSSVFKKIFKKHGRDLFAATLVLSAVLLLFLSGINITVTREARTVSAASSDNISGYAWSNNVGWISLNCTNSNSCATSNYGVHVNPSTGNFSGYAWNDNVGWIS